MDSQALSEVVLEPKVEMDEDPRRWVPSSIKALLLLLFVWSRAGHQTQGLAHDTQMIY